MCSFELNCCSIHCILWARIVFNIEVEFGVVQERDNMQKTQFLKAMSDMWTSFDARVLRYKVRLHSFYFPHLLMCRWTWALGINLMIECFFPWPDHVGSFYVESFKVITCSWWRFCFLVWKVLLPLCAELRNEVMQPMVLPMVLTIAESQVIMVQSWGAFIWNMGWYNILFVL